MGTTRIQLYNAALGECEERKLASLTEERAPRRMLDDVWDNGFVADVLSQGQWSFGTRSIEIASDDDVETLFGYSYAFEHPTDHVRTVALCSDERFQVPLTGYQVEAGFWYADIDPIWLRYISSDADYGGDLSAWPSDFCRFAELYLAWRIHPRMTGSNADRKELEKRLKRARTEVRSVDAMGKPTQFAPQGSWVSSRGGDSSRSERGSRSRLIG